MVSTDPARLRALAEVAALVGIGEPGETEPAAVFGAANAACTHPFYEVAVVSPDGGAVVSNCGVALQSRRIGGQPDTLLVAGAPHAINMSLFKNLRYDLARDLAPVTNIAAFPSLIAIHPSVPVKSIKELIALAKARPGELNYSSSGSGSSSHLAIELLKHMTGINLVHVPFKGSGQSMPALLAGQVQMIFDPLPTSLPHAKSGKLRALAVSTVKRSPAAPDVPTAAEAGVPGYDSSLWYGLLLPAGAHATLVEKLNKATNDALRAPDLVERFAALGPADSKGRSLRQFDLETRLFKYPCSFLIYSEAFDLLPKPMREHLLQRLHEILTGQDTSPEFARVEPELRRAILEEGMRRVETFASRYRLAELAWPGSGEAFLNVNTPAEFSLATRRLASSSRDRRLSKR